MRRFGEHYREAPFGEDAEKSAASGVCSVIGRVENPMRESIAVPADIRPPLQVQSSCIFADRLSVLVEVAPRHELLDVLDLNVVGVDSLDVSKEMLGQRPAVGVAGLASFGLTEIRTFEAGPQDDERIGILPPHFGDMSRQRGEFQHPNILREVQRVGMIGGMRGNRICIMVYASDDLCTLPSLISGVFNAGRGSTCSAK